MSEKIRSSTENKYSKKTKLAVGLLIAAGAVGLAGCGDNEEAQSTADASVSQSAEVNNTQDISKYIEGNQYILSYADLSSWVNDPDGTKMYSDIGPMVNSDVEHQVDLVDLGYLPNNQTGLASIYVSGGVEAVISSIQEGQGNLESLEALESLLVADIEYLEFQKLYPQDIIDYIIRGLEADLVITRIILDNASVVETARGVSCANITTAGTFRYPVGCNIPSTINPDVVPDPAGVSPYLKVTGLTTNSYNIVAKIETIADDIQVSYAVKPDSGFPKPR